MRYLAHKNPHADWIHTENNNYMSKLSVKKCIYKIKFKQFVKIVCILFRFIKITYQMACAPSEDSNQIGHQFSMDALYVAKGPKFLQAES